MKAFTIAAIAVMSVLTGCSRHVPTNPDGTWQRPISDEELGIRGTEILTFGDSSRCHIQNLMVLNYTDSTFDCNLTFTTSIAAKWSIDSLNTVTITPDTTLYKFVPDAIRLTCTARGCDADTTAMKADLISLLDDYYNSIYRALAENDGLELKDMTISGEATLTATSDGTRLIWRRAQQ